MRYEKTMSVSACVNIKCNLAIISRVWHLRKIFEDRGITVDKEVTSYCTVGIRSGYVYFLLRLMGYSRVSNYDASIVEWSADTSLPMSKLPKYQMIVNTAWVNDLMKAATMQSIFVK